MRGEGRSIPVVELAVQFERLLSGGAELIRKIRVFGGVSPESRPDMGVGTVYLLNMPAAIAVNRPKSDDAGRDYFAKLTFNGADSKRKGTI